MDRIIICYDWKIKTRCVMDATKMIKALDVAGYKRVERVTGELNWVYAIEKGGNE